MKKEIIIGIVLSTATSLASGENWPKLLDDLVSTDSSISAAARDYAFRTALPRLESMDAAALNGEIQQILPLMQDKRENVRMQASGIIAGLASIRLDSSVSIAPAIPILLEQFKDTQARVRENAIFTIITLRPIPPSEALQPLVDLLQDENLRIEGGAIAGLSRLAAFVPAADDALRTYLSSEKRPDRLIAAVYNIGEAKYASPATVALMAPLLTYKDERVNLAVADAFRKLGPKAAGAKESLRDVLSDSASSDELRDITQKALNAVGGQR